MKDNSDSLSLTHLISNTMENNANNTNNLLATQSSAGGINISLNDKIAMCSSMIGYCHYIE